MKKSLILVSLLATFAVAVFSPSTTHADVVSLQATSLLPSNGTCVPLQVSNVRTYVYDNALNSFDFTINDNSYVAVGGSVDSEHISFNQVSRWGTGVPYETRLHVDIESTDLATVHTVSVSLVSAKIGGAPVCATVFSFTIPPTSGIPGTPVIPTFPTTPTYPAYEPSVPVQPTQTTPEVPVTNNVPGEGSGATPTKPAIGLPALPTIKIPTVADAQQKLVAACATARSASNIWAILLVLYALFVAYCALTKPGILARSTEALAAAIVLPFVGLVLFWYVAQQCRAGEWVQLLTPAIALIGLAIAFWDEKGSTAQTTQLPL